MLLIALFLVCATVALGCAGWSALWSWAAGIDAGGAIELHLPPMLLVMLAAMGVLAIAGVLELRAPRAARAVMALALALAGFALAWPPLHIYAGWSLLR